MLRDDEQALRIRIAALETDLSRAHDRSESTESDCRRLRAALAAARRDLAELRSGDGLRTGLRFLVLAAAILFGVAALLAAIASLSPSSAGPRPPPGPPAAAAAR